MSKKKILSVIFIFIIIASIILIATPYKISTNKLISKNNYNYTYIEARALDLNLMDSSVSIDNDKVAKLVHTIDELSVIKSRKPTDGANYSVTFVATYKKNDGITYTEPVFTIKFYENHIIGFKEEPNYREKYYKINNKEFDIREIIKELLEMSLL